MTKPELLKVALTTFETEPCPRCKGSGTYSYCNLWGHTCFQCGYQRHVPGTGRRLTKRGTVAKQRFFSNLPRRAARDLRPGDVIVRDGQARTVESIRPNISQVLVNGSPVPGARVDVWCQGMIYGLVPEDSEFSLAPDTDAVVDALQEALIFQDLALTKAGRPRRSVPSSEGER